MRMPNTVSACITCDDEENLDAKLALSARAEGLLARKKGTVAECMDKAEANTDKKGKLDLDAGMG